MEKEEARDSLPRAALDEEALEQEEVNRRLESFVRSYNPGLQGRMPVREVIIIQREPTLFDMIPHFMGLAVYGLVMQTIFMIWEKANKRSHDICIFLMLFLFPPLLFLYLESYLLPVCWLVFTLLVLSTAMKAIRRPSDSDSFRGTYKLFKNLFIISNAGIFLGQSMTFASFYLFSVYLKYPLMFFLFFLYFGLLSREAIFFLSELMALSTGFYSKEGIPGKGSSSTLCMLCTKDFDRVESVHTLVCGHSFHNDCIRGWCLIGKKSFCPYCRKKVESALLPSDFWMRTETWFYPLINVLRGFIVFTLIITGIIIFKLRRASGASQ
jgi:RING finger protein 121/175